MSALLKIGNSSKSTNNSRLDERSISCLIAAPFFDFKKELEDIKVKTPLSLKAFNPLDIKYV